MPAPSQGLGPDRVNEETWDAMLKGLQEFHVANGHWKVPARGVSYDGRNHGAWLRNQVLFYQNGVRGQYPSLSETRIQKMQDVGFQFEEAKKYNHKEKWSAMWAASLDFCAQHGHFDIPKDVMHEGKGLRKWLHMQQTKYQNIENNKRPVLESYQIAKMIQGGYDFDAKRVKQSVERTRERLMMLSKVELGTYGSAAVSKKHFLENDLIDHYDDKAGELTLPPSKRGR
jgi:hypothetical protein